MSLDEFETLTIRQLRELTHQYRRLALKNSEPSPKVRVPTAQEIIDEISGIK